MVRAMVAIQGPPEPPVAPHKAVLRPRRLARLVLVGASVAAWTYLHPAFMGVLGALSVLIVVHEAGHLLVARACGMKVEGFSVGMGPSVASARLGEITYHLRAFPVGGFVKIVGMSGREPVQTEDEPRTFRAASSLRQMAVAVAGPAANFVLAFILLAAFYVATPTPASPVVTLVDSRAAAAGVRPGDMVARVGPDILLSPSEARKALGGGGRLVVVRDGRRVEIELPAGTAMEFEPVRAESVVASVTGAARSIPSTAWEMVQTVPSALGSPFRSLAGEKVAPEQRAVSPIGASGQVSTIVAERGAVVILALMASVSMWLGIVNLLPVPPLDGGRIVVSAAEGVASRNRGRRVRYEGGLVLATTVAVVVFIAALTVVTVGLDLTG